MKDKRQLKQISPDNIKPNPENPRIIFRQDEMESLMVSISKHGIQVPLTVYQDGIKYYILDGERRWRCSIKLNLSEIPVIIQQKPSKLQNLLLMYNIHALREQWDYYTIATNLKRIIDLFEKERGYSPNEIELSEETGLTRGQIRRCHLLIDMPPHFKEMLLKELELPKPQQKLTEDFFIEMERSLKTITKRLPKYNSKLDKIRNVLVDKFKNNTIGAVTDFRQLSKIVTAVENIGLKKEKAEAALEDIFNAKKNVGIKEIYQNTVEFEYDEKKAEQHILTLKEYFDEIIYENKQNDLADDFLGKVKELYSKLGELLGEKK